MAILYVLAIVFAISLTSEALGFLFRHFIARRIDRWAEREKRKEVEESVATQTDRP